MGPLAITAGEVIEFHEMFHTATGIARAYRLIATLKRAVIIILLAQARHGTNYSGHREDWRRFIFTATGVRARRHIIMSKLSTRTATTMPDQHR